MGLEQKLQPLQISIDEFIDSLPVEKRKDETRTLIPIFERVSKQNAVVWHTGIIGFGRYDYRYESGHSGFAPKTGFAPRKSAITFYLFIEEGDLDVHLEKLGKHRKGKGCIYVNKLEDIDLDVLEELIKESLHYLELYGKAHSWEM